MRIDWWTLALQAINVLVLVWLLARFLYRPVMDAIAARQAAADKLLTDAEAARTAAAAAEASVKAQGDAIAAQAGQQRAEMQASIDAERTRLLGEAKAAADALAAQAHAAIEVERARMAAELEEKAAILAGQMARKLLQRLPPSHATGAMFDELIARIASLSGEERRQLAEDTPLVMATPAPLDDATQARYASTLAAALPGSPALDFVVDPDLIGGVELRGPHMIVRNSWRADLDTLLAKLREDDHARLG